MTNNRFDRYKEDVAVSHVGHASRYVVQATHCNCHPETCCCEPWRIHDREKNEVIAKGFDKSKIYNLCISLNKLERYEQAEKEAIEKKNAQAEPLSELLVNGVSYKYDSRSLEIVKNWFPNVIHVYSRIADFGREDEKDQSTTSLEMDSSSYVFVLADNKYILVKCEEWGDFADISDWF